jgi:hypothetical protein
MRLRTQLAMAMAAAAGTFAACSDGDGTPTDTAPTDPGPVEVTDLLPQTVHDPVEILFVLDPGWEEGLLELTQQVLDNGFETLLLADPAWRVAMLDATASGNSFGLLGPKFETWPFPTNVFQVPGASGTPKVREAIYTALELRKEQESNVGFLRAESDLYILVFTNREDATDNIDDGITKRAFEDWLDGFEGSNSVRIGALTTSQREDYWKERAYGGGEVFVGASIRRGLEVLLRDAIGQKTVFTLNYTPTEIPAVIDVIYRDHRTEYLVEQDYLYDPETRQISFIDVVPRVDSVVRVIYETEDEVVDTEAMGTETEATSALTAR